MEQIKTKIIRMNKILKLRINKKLTILSKFHKINSKFKMLILTLIYLKQTLHFLHQFRIVRIIFSEKNLLDKRINGELINQEISTMLLGLANLIALFLFNRLLISLFYLVEEICLTILKNNKTINNQQYNKSKIFLLKVQNKNLKLRQNLNMKKNL